MATARNGRALPRIRAFLARRGLPVLLLLVSSGCAIRNGGVVISWPGNVFPAPVKKPVVPPNKILTHELRVLLLEDPDKRQNLPSAQLWMLSSKQIRDFLKSNCVTKKDARGQMVPEFRIVDGTSEGLKALTGDWKKMVDDNPPSSLPWAIFSNGASVKSYAFPTEAETFAADLETYAGAK